MKVFLRRASPWPLAGFSFLATSLILFVVSAISGFPGIGPGFFPALAITVIINIIATFLLYRALRETDLSLCLPMLAFTPVFLILTSFFILGELPSIPGAIGILLVVAGAYMLHLEYCRGRPASFIGPLRTLRRDRGVQMTLFVAFLYSISVNYDKQVVIGSDPVFGAAMTTFLIALPFLIVTLFLWARRPVQFRVRKPSSPGIPADRPFPVPVPFAYLIIGAVLALESVSINTAYTLTVVPYVITVKRLAIFFSVLYGGILLGERNLGGRVLGGMVMIAGAVIIGLLG